MNGPTSTPIILTIMPDFGFGPFLWIDRSGEDTRGVGGNCCSFQSACGNHPMSEVLLGDFSAWVQEFERADWMPGEAGHKLALDWPRFHERGLELAVRLKTEVGSNFRVIYEKPYEDPGRRCQERREVLDDGRIVPLPSRAILNRAPFGHLVDTIVSGGQAGADRAALDWALEHNYRQGGWCPKGRKAEDGVIDSRYQLRETESDGYRQRTKLNVRDSDGTLIVNIGELGGGSLATLNFCHSMDKPVLVAPLDDGATPVVVRQVIAWVREEPIATLNVAGPRESKRPGIYRLTRKLLDAVASTSREEFRARREHRP